MGEAPALKKFLGVIFGAIYFQVNVAWAGVPTMPLPLQTFQLFQKLYPKPATPVIARSPRRSSPQRGRINLMHNIMRLLHPLRGFARTEGKKVNPEEVFIFHSETQWPLRLIPPQDSYRNFETLNDLQNLGPRENESPLPQGPVLNSTINTILNQTDCPNISELKGKLESEGVDLDSSVRYFRTQSNETVIVINNDVARGHIVLKAGEAPELNLVFPAKAPSDVRDPAANSAASLRDGGQKLEAKILQSLLKSSELKSQLERGETARIPPGAFLQSDASGGIFVTVQNPNGTQSRVDVVQRGGFLVPVAVDGVKVNPFDQRNTPFQTVVKDRNGQDHIVQYGIHHFEIVSEGENAGVVVAHGFQNVGKGVEYQDGTIEPPTGDGSAGEVGASAVSHGLDVTTDGKTIFFKGRRDDSQVAFSAPLIQMGRNEAAPVSYRPVTSGSYDMTVSVQGGETLAGAGAAGELHGARGVYSFSRWAVTKKESDLTPAEKEALKYFQIPINTQEPGRNMASLINGAGIAVGSVTLDETLGASRVICRPDNIFSRTAMQDLFFSDPTSFTKKFSQVEANKNLARALLRGDYQQHCLDSLQSFQRTSIKGIDLDQIQLGKAKIQGLVFNGARELVTTQLEIPLANESKTNGTLSINWGADGDEPRFSMDGTLARALFHGQASTDPAQIGRIFNDSLLNSAGQTFIEVQGERVEVHPERLEFHRSQVTGLAFDKHGELLSTQLEFAQANGPSFGQMTIHWNERNGGKVSFGLDASLGAALFGSASHKLSPIESFLSPQTFREKNGEFFLRDTNTGQWLALDKKAITALESAQINGISLSGGRLVQTAMNVRLANGLTGSFSATWAQNVGEGNAFSVDKNLAQALLGDYFDKYKETAAQAFFNQNNLVQVGGRFFVQDKSNGTRRELSATTLESIRRAGIKGLNIQAGRIASTLFEMDLPDETKSGMVAVWSQCPGEVGSFHLESALAKALLGPESFEAHRKGVIDSFKADLRTDEQGTFIYENSNDKKKIYLDQQTIEAISNGQLQGLALGQGQILKSNLIVDLRNNTRGLLSVGWAEQGDARSSFVVDQELGTALIGEESAGKLRDKVVQTFIAENSSENKPFNADTVHRMRSADFGGFSIGEGKLAGTTLNVRLADGSYEPFSVQWAPTREAKNTFRFSSTLFSALVGKKEMEREQTRGLQAFVQKEVQWREGNAFLIDPSNRDVVPLSREALDRIPNGTLSQVTMGGGQVLSTSFQIDLRDGYAGMLSVSWATDRESRTIFTLDRGLAAALLKEGFRAHEGRAGQAFMTQNVKKDIGTGRHYTMDRRRDKKIFLDEEALRAIQSGSISRLSLSDGHIVGTSLNVNLPGFKKGEMSVNWTLEHPGRDVFSVSSGLGEALLGAQFEAHRVNIQVQFKKDLKWDSSKNQYYHLDSKTQKRTYYGADGVNAIADGRITNLSFGNGQILSTVMEVKLKNGEVSNLQAAWAAHKDTESVFTSGTALSEALLGEYAEAHRMGLIYSYVDGGVVRWDKETKKHWVSDVKGNKIPVSEDVIRAIRVGWLTGLSFTGGDIAQTVLTVDFANGTSAKIKANWEAGPNRETTFSTDEEMNRKLFGQHYKSFEQTLIDRFFNPDTLIHHGGRFFLTDVANGVLRPVDQDALASIRSSEWVGSTFMDGRVISSTLKIRLKDGVETQMTAQPSGAPGNAMAFSFGPLLGESLLGRDGYQAYQAGVIRAAATKAIRWDERGNHYFYFENNKKVVVDYDTVESIKKGKLESITIGDGCIRGSVLSVSLGDRGQGRLSIAWNRLDPQTSTFQPDRILTQALLGENFRGTELRLCQDYQGSFIKKNGKYYRQDGWVERKETYKKTVYTWDERDEYYAKAASCSLFNPALLYYYAKARNAGKTKKTITAYRIIREPNLVEVPADQLDSNASRLTGLTLSGGGQLLSSHLEMITKDEVSAGHLSVNADAPAGSPKFNSDASLERFLLGSHFNSHRTKIVNQFNEALQFGFQNFNPGERDEKAHLSDLNLADAEIGGLAVSADGKILQTHLDINFNSSGLPAGRLSFSGFADGRGAEKFTLDESLSQVLLGSGERSHVNRVKGEIAANLDRSPGFLKVELPDGSRMLMNPWDISAIPMRVSGLSINELGEIVKTRIEMNFRSGITGHTTVNWVAPFDSGRVVFDRTAAMAFFGVDNLRLLRQIAGTHFNQSLKENSLADNRQVDYSNGDVLGVSLARGGRLVDITTRLSLNHGQTATVPTQFQRQSPSHEAAFGKQVVARHQVDGASALAIFGDTGLNKINTAINAFTPGLNADVRSGGMTLSSSGQMSVAINRGDNGLSFDLEAKSGQTLTITGASARDGRTGHSLSMVQGRDFSTIKQDLTDLHRLKDYAGIGNNAMVVKGDDVAAFCRKRGYTGGTLHYWDDQDLVVSQEESGLFGTSVVDRLRGRSTSVRGDVEYISAKSLLNNPIRNVRDAIKLTNRRNSFYSGIQSLSYTDENGDKITVFRQDIRENYENRIYLVNGRFATLESHGVLKKNYRGHIVIDTYSVQSLASVTGSNVAKELKGAMIVTRDLVPELKPELRNNAIREVDQMECDALGLKERKVVLPSGASYSVVFRNDHEGQSHVTYLKDGAWRDAAHGNALNDRFTFVVEKTALGPNEIQVTGFKNGKITEQGLLSQADGRKALATIAAANPQTEGDWVKLVDKGPLKTITLYNRSGLMGKAEVRGHIVLSRGKEEKINRHYQVSHETFDAYKKEFLPWIRRGGEGVHTVSVGILEDSSFRQHWQYSHAGSKGMRVAKFDLDGARFEATVSWRLVHQFVWSGEKSEKLNPGEVDLSNDIGSLEEAEAFVELMATDVHGSIKALEEFGKEKGGWHGFLMKLDFLSLTLGSTMASDGAGIQDMGAFDRNGNGVLIDFFGRELQHEIKVDTHVFVKEDENGNIFYETRNYTSDNGRLRYESTFQKEDGTFLEKWVYEYNGDLTKQKWDSGKNNWAEAYYDRNQIDDYVNILGWEVNSTKLMAVTVGAVAFVVALALTPFTGGASLGVWATLFVAAMAGVGAYQSIMAFRNGMNFEGAVLMIASFLPVLTAKAWSPMVTANSVVIARAVQVAIAAQLANDLYKKYYLADDSVTLWKLGLDVLALGMPFLGKWSAAFSKASLIQKIGVAAGASTAGLVAGLIHSHFTGENAIESMVKGAALFTTAVMALPVANWISKIKIGDQALGMNQAITMAARSAVWAAIGGVGGGLTSLASGGDFIDGLWKGGLVGALLLPLAAYFKSGAQALGQEASWGQKILNVVKFGVVPAVLVGGAYTGFAFATGHEFKLGELLAVMVAGAMIGGFARLMAKNLENIFIIGGETPGVNKFLLPAHAAKYYEAAFKTAMGWATFGFLGVGALIPSYDFGHTDPSTGEHVEGKGWIWNPGHTFKMSLRERLQAAFSSLQDGLRVGSLLNLAGFQPTTGIAHQFMQRGPTGAVAWLFGAETLYNAAAKTGWGVIYRFGQAALLGAAAGAAATALYEISQGRNLNLKDVGIGAGVGLIAGLGLAAGAWKLGKSVDPGKSVRILSYSEGIRALATQVGRFAQRIDRGFQSLFVNGKSLNAVAQKKVNEQIAQVIHTALAGAEGLIPIHTMTQVGNFFGYGMGRAFDLDWNTTKALTEAMGTIAMFFSPMPEFKQKYLQEQIKEGNKKILGDIEEAKGKRDNDYQKNQSEAEDSAQVKPGEVVIQVNGVNIRVSEPIVILAQLKTLELISEKGNEALYRSINNEDSYAEGQRVKNIKGFETHPLGDLYISPEVQSLLRSQLADYLMDNKVSAAAIVNQTEIKGFKISPENRITALRTLFQGVETIETVEGLLMDIRRVESPETKPEFYVDQNGTIRVKQSGQNLGQGEEALKVDARAVKDIAQEILHMKLTFLAKENAVARAAEVKKEIEGILEGDKTKSGQEKLTDMQRKVLKNALEHASRDSAAILPMLITMQIQARIRAQSELGKQLSEMYDQKDMKEFFSERGVRVDGMKGYIEAIKTREDKIADMLRGSDPNGPFARSVRLLVGDPEGTTKDGSKSQEEASKKAASLILAAEMGDTNRVEAILGANGEARELLSSFMKPHLDILGLKVGNDGRGTFMGKDEGRFEVISGRALEKVLKRHNWKIQDLLHKENGVVLMKELAKEAYKKDLGSLTFEQHMALALLRERVFYENSKSPAAKKGWDGEKAVGQFAFVLNGLAGRISALATSAGKSAGFGLVFGIMQMRGKLSVGELLVALPQDVTSFINDYKDLTNAFGLKLVDGTSLYKNGGKEGYARLIQAYEAKGKGHVIVFDLDSRGFVELTARTGNARLNQVLDHVTVRGIDEADVAALSQKAFRMSMAAVDRSGYASLGLRKRIGQTIDDVEQALKDYDKRHPGDGAYRIDGKRVDLSSGFYEFLKQKKLVDGKGDGTANELDARIANILRARHANKTLGETGDWYTANGKARYAGTEYGKLQFGTSDGSNTFNVAIALYRMRSILGGEKASTCGQIAEGKLRRSQREALQKDRLNPEEIEISRGFGEATLSRIFARHPFGNYDVLNFGGSATMDVAKEIASLIYGARAVALQGSTLSEYGTISGQKHLQIMVREGDIESQIWEILFERSVRGKFLFEEGMLIADTSREGRVDHLFTALKAKYGKPGRAEYGNLNGKEAIEQWRKDKAAEIRDMTEAQILEKVATEILYKKDKTRITAYDILIDTSSDAALTDSICKRAQNLDVDVILAGTNPQIVAKLARYAAGRIIIGNESAGRALDFSDSRDLPGGGKFEEGLMHEIVLGYEGRTIGELLQTLGRVGRSSESKLEARRFLLVDTPLVVENLKQAIEIDGVLNGKTKRRSLFKMTSGGKSTLQDNLDQHREETKGKDDGSILELFKGNGDLLRRSVELTAEFNAAKAKALSVEFKMSTETHNILVKDPLASLIMAAESRELAGGVVRASDIALLRATYQRVVEGSERASLKPSQEYKSPDQIALEQYKGTLEQAKAVWGELREKLKKGSDLQAIAEERYQDIVGTLKDIGAKFQRARDQGTSQETFADIKEGESKGTTMRLLHIVVSMTDLLLPSKGVAEQVGSVKTAPKTIAEFEVAAANKTRGSPRLTEVRALMDDFRTYSSNNPSEPPLLNPDGILTSRGQAVASFALLSLDWDDKERRTQTDPLKIFIDDLQGGNDLVSMSVTLADSLASTYFGGRYEPVNFSVVLQLARDMDAVTASPKDVEKELLQSILLADAPYDRLLEAIVDGKITLHGKMKIEDLVQAKTQKREEKQTKEEFAYRHMVHKDNGESRVSIPAQIGRFLWQTVTGQASFFPWSRASKIENGETPKAQQILDMAGGKADLAAALTSILIGGLPLSPKKPELENPRQTIEEVFSDGSKPDGRNLGRVELQDLKDLANDNSEVGRKKFDAAATRPFQVMKSPWVKGATIGLVAGAVGVGIAAGAGLIAIPEAALGGLAALLGGAGASSAALISAPILAKATMQLFTGEKPPQPVGSGFNKLKESLSPYKGKAGIAYMGLNLGFILGLGKILAGLNPAGAIALLATGWGLGKLLNSTVMKDSSPRLQAAATIGGTAAGILAAKSAGILGLVSGIAAPVGATLAPVVGAVAAAAALGAAAWGIAWAAKKYIVQPLVNWLTPKNELRREALDFLAMNEKAAGLREKIIQARTNERGQDIQLQGPLTLPEIIEVIKTDPKIKPELRGLVLRLFLEKEGFSKKRTVEIVARFIAREIVAEARKEGEQYEPNSILSRKLQEIKKALIKAGLSEGETNEFEKLANEKPSSALSFEILQGLDLEGLKNNDVNIGTLEFIAGLESGFGDEVLTLSGLEAAILQNSASQVSQSDVCQYYFGTDKVELVKDLYQAHQDRLQVVQRANQTRGSPGEGTVSLTPVSAPDVRAFARSLRNWDNPTFNLLNAQGFTDPALAKASNELASVKDETLAGMIRQLKEAGIPDSVIKAFAADVMTGKQDEAREKLKNMDANQDLPRVQLNLDRYFDETQTGQAGINLNENDIGVLSGVMGLPNTFKDNCAEKRPMYQALSTIYVTQGMSVARVSADNLWEVMVDKPEGGKEKIAEIKKDPDTINLWVAVPTQAGQMENVLTLQGHSDNSIVAMTFNLGEAGTRVIEEYNLKEKKFEGRNPKDGKFQVELRLGEEQRFFRILEKQPAQAETAETFAQIGPIFATPVYPGAFDTNGNSKETNPEIQTPENPPVPRAEGKANHPAAQEGEKESVPPPSVQLDTHLNQAVQPEEAAVAAAEKPVPAQALAPRALLNSIPKELLNWLKTLPVAEKMNLQLAVFKESGEVWVSQGPGRNWQKVVVQEGNNFSLIPAAVNPLIFRDSGFATIYSWDGKKFWLEERRPPKVKDENLAESKTVAQEAKPGEPGSKGSAIIGKGFKGTAVGGLILAILGGGALQAAEVGADKVVTLASQAGAADPSGIILAALGMAVIGLVAYKSFNFVKARRAPVTVDESAMLDVPTDRGAVKVGFASGVADKLRAQVQAGGKTEQVLFAVLKKQGQGYIVTDSMRVPQLEIIGGPRYPTQLMRELAARLAGINPQNASAEVAALLQDRTIGDQMKNINITPLVNSVLGQTSINIPSSLKGRIQNGEAVRLGEVFAMANAEVGEFKNLVYELVARNGQSIAALSGVYFAGTYLAEESQKRGQILIPLHTEPVRAGQALLPSFTDRVTSWSLRRFFGEKKMEYPGFLLMASQDGRQFTFFNTNTRRTLTVDENMKPLAEQPKYIPYQNIEVVLAEPVGDGRRSGLLSLLPRWLSDMLAPKVKTLKPDPVTMFFGDNVGSKTGMTRMANTMVSLVNEIDKLGLSYAESKMVFTMVGFYALGLMDKGRIDVYLSQFNGSTVGLDKLIMQLGDQMRNAANPGAMRFANSMDAVHGVIRHYLGVSAWPAEREWVIQKVNEALDIRLIDLMVAKKRAEELKRSLRGRANIEQLAEPLLALAGFGQADFVSRLNEAMKGVVFETSEGVRAAFKGEKASVKAKTVALNLLAQGLLEAIIKTSPVSMTTQTKEKLLESLNIVVKEGPTGALRPKAEGAIYKSKGLIEITLDPELKADEAFQQAVGALTHELAHAVEDFAIKNYAVGGLGVPTVISEAWAQLTASRALRFLNLNLIADVADMKTFEEIAKQEEAQVGYFDLDVIKSERDVEALVQAVGVDGSRRNAPPRNAVVLGTPAEMKAKADLVSLLERAQVQVMNVDDIVKNLVPSTNETPLEAHGRLFFGTRKVRLVTNKAQGEMKDSWKALLTVVGGVQSGQLVEALIATLGAASLASRLETIYQERMTDLVASRHA